MVRNQLPAQEVKQNVRSVCFLNAAPCEQWYEKFVPTDRVLVNLSVLVRTNQFSVARMAGILAGDVTVALHEIQ